MSSWQTIDSPRAASPSPAIYAIYRGGRLYYIGCTRNLKRRLYQHKYSKNGVGGDAATAIKVRYSEKFEEQIVERRLIARLRPPGNKQVLLDGQNSNKRESEKTKHDSYRIVSTNVPRLVSDPELAWKVVSAQMLTEATCFFHSKSPNGDICWQGKMLGRVGPGQILVQLFEWGWGEPSIQKIVNISDMMDWDLYSDEVSWREAGDRWIENGSKRWRSEVFGDEGK